MLDRGLYSPVEGAILRGTSSSAIAERLHDACSTSNRKPVNFRLKGAFRAEVYGPLDRRKIVQQLCCRKFSVKETL